MCCSAHSVKVGSHDHSAWAHHSALGIAAKVSVVALAAIAFMTDKALFYASFALGFILGAYRGGCIDQVLQKENIVFPGLIENITGVRLPDSLCLAINVSSYAIHLDHHPALFVPATGLAVGAWAGHHAARLFAQRCSQLELLR